MTSITEHKTADPRQLLAMAIDTATPIVAGVRPDQMGASTPCTEFEVKGLLGHLVFVLDRLAKIGRDEDGAFSEEGRDSEGSGDWLADWNAKAAEARAAWSDDNALTREVVAPWATMSGADMLATYLNELTVHAWDLTTATGQSANWDDSVCGLALAAMRRSLPMADRAPMWEAFVAQMPAGVPFQPPFANAVEVADDAPLINQVVAWSGRRP